MLYVKFTKGRLTRFLLLSFKEMGMTTEICPESGHEMRRGVKSLTLTYKGHSETFDMPGWHCDECGEGIHTGKDMEVSDRALHRAKAKVEGLLAPEAIRRIRKRLGLTQKDADRLMGVDPGAFRKYESGDALINRAVSGLLVLLERDPGGLALIAWDLKGQTAGRG